MAAPRALLLLCISLSVLSLTQGQGSTNSRSDRIAQAISASGDAISSAVGGRTSVQAAALKSKDFAKMAARDGVQPSDFGRKLLAGATNSGSDRIAQAISASGDAISSAVGGRTSVQAAVASGRDYAKLASREASRPSDFGH